MERIELSFSESDLAEVISLAKLGDQQSLDHLCQGLLPHIRHWCHIHFPECLKAKVGESDLVQESILGASENIASLKGSQYPDLLAWVQGIVENKARDLQRRFLLAEKRDATREKTLTQLESSQWGILLKDSSPGPLDQLMTVELIERIQRLVAKLPAHYQQIVMLRHQDGLTLPEIASRIGKTEAAVKKIYYRAVSSLKDDIKRA